MKGFTCMQDKCLWCLNSLYNIKSLWDLSVFFTGRLLEVFGQQGCAGIWRQQDQQSMQRLLFHPEGRGLDWRKEEGHPGGEEHAPLSILWRMTWIFPFFKIILPWSYAFLYRSRRLSSQAVASYVAFCSTVRKTSPGRECGVSSPRRRLLCSISTELRR